MVCNKRSVLSIIVIHIVSFKTFRDSNVEAVEAALPALIKFASFSQSCDENMVIMSMYIEDVVVDFSGVSEPTRTGGELSDPTSSLGRTTAQSCPSCGASECSTQARII